MMRGFCFWEGIFTMKDMKGRKGDVEERGVLT